MLTKKSVWILWHYEVIENLPSNALIINVFSSKEKAVERVLQLLSNNAQDGGQSYYEMNNFDNLICFRLKNEYYEISEEEVF